jgi:hypothetical protein
MRFAPLVLYFSVNSRLAAGLLVCVSSTLPLELGPAP